MLDTNRINIDGSGNITLQNIHGSTITINKGDDANAIMAKLAQLHEAQLDALQQITEKQGEKTEGIFKQALQDFFKTAGLEKGKHPTLQEHRGSGYNVAGDKITYLIQPAPSIPPELTINLPKIPDLTKIIGREQDLKQVRDLLQEKQKVVVVNGLGGIGKTTVAQAYLTQYGGAYAHLFWLTQSEGDNFMLDLITAPGLTLNLGIETSGKDAQTLFTEIIAQLKSISADKPNLLVIDNANATLQHYFDYLPKPPQWHILATSRDKMERFFVKDLDFLTEDHAVLLFRQHCQRIADEAQIKSLLKTIDYHTLTIEILAKTAQRYDTPLSTLQQAIERDLKAEVYIPHKGDKIEKVTSYLLSIFDLAPLSAEEQRLLQHFAALPAEFIPYDILKTLIPAPEEGIAATLQDLRDKGWLIHTNEPEAYKIHRIIQQVVQQKLHPTVADLHNLINNVTSLLHIDDTKDNPVDKFPFIPYGEAALSVFPDASEAEINHLQNALALVLQDLGDYAGAKALLEKATRSAETNFGENHPTTARLYSNLATVLQDLGDYAGAKALLEKAMRSDETNFGENHPTTAVSYSNLATVLKDLGDYAGAKALLEEAVRSNEVNFGENHPTTAICYSNLALVLKDLGDYAGAKVLLEKATRSDEANFGENHPATARCYSNLALVLYNMEEYENAIQSAVKAYRIYVGHLGEQHPNAKIIKGNIDGFSEEMLKNGWTEEQIQELTNT
jgi:tetratricopeptide (TPR) repeat protein